MESLLDGLISWWTLSDPDSARHDFHGTFPLDDNNTVVSAVGLGGRTAASFNAANTEYLSIADRADLRGGDRDFTVSAWFRIDPLLPWPAHPVVAAKRGATIDWQLGASGTTSPAQFRFFYGAAQAAGPAGGIVAGTWYHAVAWRDDSAGQIRLQINGGTVFSAASAAPAVPGAEMLAIGRPGSLSTSYFSGLIQDVPTWSRVLTDDERAALYNNGAGLTYSDIMQPASGVSWPLLHRVAALGDVRVSRPFTPAMEPIHG